MIMKHAAEAALLCFGVLAQGICCLGMVMAKNPFDRLHLQAPAAILGPSSIAIAIALHAGLWPAGIKALLAAAFVAATNPLVGLFTARALLARDPRAAEAAGPIEVSA
jgi:multisubunit Na+/H+ antiporter MnhG subunit